MWIPSSFIARSRRLARGKSDCLSVPLSPRFPPLVVAVLRWCADLLSLFLSLAIVYRPYGYRASGHVYVAKTLATGKKLQTKQSYIKVTYHDGQSDIFEEGKILKEDRIPDAYERVLIEAIEGRHAIFTTGPEVLKAWEIVRPVQQSWEMNNQLLPLYAPGTSVEDLLD